MSAKVIRDQPVLETYTESIDTEQPKSESEKTEVFPLTKFCAIESFVA